MSSPKGPCGPCESRSPGSNTKDPNSELSGRPLLFTGVLWIQVMRRFLLPRRDEPCDSIPPTENSKPINVSHVSSNAAFEQSQVRRSPLQHPVPLTSKHEATSEEINTRTTKQRENIQKRYSQIAELLHQATDHVHQANEAVNDFIAESKAATEETVNMIRQEDAVVRYGVITLSGFVGYLFGLRRTVFPRFLYSATGATAAVAICYPRETVHYNQKALEMVNKLVVLGIEFGRPKPFNRIEKTDSKTNNRQSSSRQTETPGAKPQADRQPTKLTSESFTSPENDFKHYQNYYEGARPRPKSDQLQNSKKVEKVDEKNMRSETHNSLPNRDQIPNEEVGKVMDKINIHSEAHPPPQSSNLIPKSIQELPNPPLAIPEEPMKKSEEAANVLPPAVPSQEQVSMDILHPPLHSDSVHRRNISTEKLELKPKYSLTKTESQHQDEIFPENQDLHTEVTDTAPDFKINSECLVSDDIQVENRTENIFTDQYVPLNKKLSQYYKKNPENMTISINDEETNIKKN